MKGLFITGTDTDVGKTYISCLIAAELTARNIKVIPRKPIESGCLRDGDKLLPRDAVALKSASNYSGSLQHVCPYRFEPAISPQRAAQLSNQRIVLNDLISACRPESDDADEFLMVEGAGGFYSPLCEDGLNADLAQALKLPVVLVTEDKVGCINQVLLTVEAISARKLKLLGVILNTSITHAPQAHSAMDNLYDLRKRLSCPVISHSYQSTSLDINQLNFSGYLL